MSQKRGRGRFQMIENSPLNAIIDFAFVCSKEAENSKRGLFPRKGRISVEFRGRIMIAVAIKDL